jgi:hypothetical protein
VFFNALIYNLPTQLNVAEAFQKNGVELDSLNKFRNNLDIEMWHHFDQLNGYKIFRQLDINESDLFMRLDSGGIFFQNFSLLEEYGDNIMLTWNSGII